MRRDARRVAIVGLHSLEFLDEIPPVTIIRVLLQSSYDVPEVLRLLGMVGNRLLSPCDQSGW